MIRFTVGAGIGVNYDLRPSQGLNDIEATKDVAVFIRNNGLARPTLPNYRIILDFLAFLSRYYLIDYNIVLLRVLDV
jgi:hypothetical protein